MKFMEMMKRKNNKKGFTLVELMVVVVIIGILVAIAVPVYNASSARAELGRCQANQRMIEGAIQQYIANTPTYSEADVASGGWTFLDGYFKDGVPQCDGDDYTYSATTHQVTCPNGHAHY
jgi:type IV pilus assembly protein PilA